MQVPKWERYEEWAKLIEPRYKKLSILALGSSISTPAEGTTAEAIVVRDFNELTRRKTEVFLVFYLKS